jgi:hypothetical protein
MTPRLLSLGAALTMLASVAFAQDGEKLFVETSDNTIKAFAPSGQICNASMHYTVRAAVADIYYPYPDRVESLLGTLRYAVQASCPNAQRILLRGFVGDELYFAAVAPVDQNGKMVWLAAPPR